MEKAMESSMNNKAFGAILNQIGLFNVLPMIVENSLEDSFLPAIEDFLTMQLQHPSNEILYRLGMSGSTSIAVYLLTWIYVVMAVVIYVLTAYARNTLADRTSLLPFGSVYCDCT
ncbi:hypothetical protein GIB67_033580 [Kingdonia uniflora]|uniref:Uncharacterized protein n=1 Tax=Kingdonia uniflora TaxID=39325 RepID=A0A7J7L2M1_9MAGN|nr:hypothetical protein GIB67_033580 [Kingdonia uniflora]